ncbi:hypothetical protein [Caballeronia pedi]|uniref:hypothetical protein n=1 Tax=Caballeronia pedi TaxID=1777141 RepID=UPI000A990445|nr:hypothetical protein [Caballeronia pedi]
MSAAVQEQIEDLQRRVEALERERDMRRSIGPIEASPARGPLPGGNWPFIPPNAIPNLGEQHCPKCGITLAPVMGYVCGRGDCPTGLGGMICVAQTGSPT